MFYKDKPLYRPDSNIDTTKLTLGQKFLTIALIGFCGLLLVGFGSISAIKSFSEWSQNHYVATQSFDYRITWPRVWIATREPKITYVQVAGSAYEAKELTENEKKEIIAKSGYGKILSGVRMLESTNNTQRDQTAHHVDCEKVGASNEFGYDALNDTCFSTFNESVQTVSKWFDDKLKTLSLNASLCLYNTGRATDVCTYAKNFAALDEQGQLAVN